METLFNEEIIFHRHDSKTNRCIDIPVRKDFMYLEFLCSYEPKWLDDDSVAQGLIEDGLEKYVPPEYRACYGDWRDYLPVANLVTLSLDHDGIYVGCAHRHDPKQRHIISADFSSPGFLRYPARAGEWRAVINVHAVVSVATHYHLRVNAFDREVATCRASRDPVD
jgi:hypothetical protein